MSCPVCGGALGHRHEPGCLSIPLPEGWPADEPVTVRIHPFPDTGLPEPQATEARQVREIVDKDDDDGA